MYMYPLLTSRMLHNINFKEEFNRLGLSFLFQGLVAMPSFKNP